jgi:hypothetical protein
MALTVVTPAASDNLISLSEVKERLEISGSASDRLLGIFIRGASSGILEYLGSGFHLGRQRYRETFSGNGRRSLYLSRFPVDPESITFSGDGAEITADLNPEIGEIFRQCGWPATSTEAPDRYEVTYTAGYLLPDQVQDWEASVAIRLGAFVRPSAASVLRMECTVAGNTGEAEPTWPSAPGITVVDGEVTWVSRSAIELPFAFHDHAFLEAATRYQKRLMPGGVSSMNADGFSVSFIASQTATDLLPSTQAFLDRWMIGRGVVS